jgi:hypothetical protein
MRTERYATYRGQPYSLHCIQAQQDADSNEEKKNDYLKTLYQIMRIIHAKKMIAAAILKAISSTDGRAFSTFLIVR